MSKVLWISLVSTQLSSASISVMASSLTAIMIARSRTSTGQSPLRSSSYHRIIFSLSISDILHSIAIITGPFAAPASVPQALWGVGNTKTCNMNGFFMVLGATATPMYILLLCVYCLFSIRRTRPNQARFPKWLELTLHGFIILFNVCLCIAGLVTKSLNTWAIGSACGIAAYPAGCRQNPGIFGECDKDIAKYSLDFSYISSIGVPFVCLSSIILIMGMICWHVLRTNAMFRREEGGADVSVPVSSLRQKVTSTDSSLCRPGDELGTASPVGSSSNFNSQQNSGVALKEFVEDHHDPEPATPLYTDNATAVQSEAPAFNSHGQNKTDCHAMDLNTDHRNQGKEGDDEVELMQQQIKRTDDAEALIRAASREIIIQAFLFVLAFFATYIFWWATYFYLLFLKRSPPMFLVILTSSISPLGGLFYILVYTRPKVSSFVRLNGAGRYSWLCNFFRVVMAGVVVPRPPRSALIEGSSTTPGEEGKKGSQNESGSNLVTSKGFGAEYYGSPDRNNLAAENSNIQDFGYINRSKRESDGLVSSDEYGYNLVVSSNNLGNGSQAFDNVSQLNTWSCDLVGRAESRLSEKTDSGYEASGYSQRRSNENYNSIDPNYLCPSHKESH